MTKLVGDGCVYHVCIKVDTDLLLAAHDGKQMALVSQAVAAAGTENRRKFESLCMAEMEEGTKVDAARIKIEELMKIALRPILSASLVPELVASEDEVELRLLL